MNARALLQAQGWRGDGHTLHATSDSIGLKKRLIVGRKDNTAGLGASQYANDQWWLSALDEQLTGIDTSGGKLVQKTKDGKLDRLNDNRSPLYKLFVRGGTLDGTVDILPTETAKKVPEKNEPLHIKATLAVSNAPTSMIASASRDGTESSSSSSASASKTKESKEERRARKEARRQRRERKRTRREAKKAKTSATSSDADSSSKSNKAAKSETKEERRARREARRKRREEKEKRRLKG